MPVELSLLMQLVAGQKTSLPVGDLPHDVAKYLKCHPAIAYLGHKEVTKIVRKHGDVRIEQLQSLPYAIKDGEYRDDPGRGNCVTIYWENPTDRALYLIGLKSASIGGEVWVQTFHKTT